MAINPNAPLMPEMDVSLLSGTGDFVPNSPGYPEIDITLLPGVPGQRGPTGPTGPGVTNEQILALIPAAVSYRHVQSSAQTTWAITHNLHFRPNVTAFDSAGNTVEGNVTHISTDALTIQFSVAISGTATLS
jgi:hypothetical protein